MVKGGSLGSYDGKGGEWYNVRWQWDCEIVKW